MEVNLENCHDAIRCVNAEILSHGKNPSLDHIRQFLRAVETSLLNKQDQPLVTNPKEKT